MMTILEKIRPMSKKVAKQFHGKEFWNRTNSCLCECCKQSNFFHGNEQPVQYECVYCGHNNGSPK